MARCASTVTVSLYIRLRVNWYFNLPVIISSNQLVEIHHLLRENHRFLSGAREVAPDILSATNCKQAAYTNTEVWTSLALALHSSKTSVSRCGLVQS